MGEMETVRESAKGDVGLCKEEQGLWDPTCQPYSVGLEELHSRGPQGRGPERPLSWGRGGEWGGWFAVVN